MLFSADHHVWLQYFFSGDILFLDYLNADIEQCIMRYIQYI